MQGLLWYKMKRKRFKKLSKKKLKPLLPKFNKSKKTQRSLKNKRHLMLKLQLRLFKKSSMFNRRAIKLRNIYRFLKKKRFLLNQTKWSHHYINMKRSLTKNSTRKILRRKILAGIPLQQVFFLAKVTSPSKN